LGFRYRVTKSTDYLVQVDHCEIPRGIWVDNTRHHVVIVSHSHLLLCK